MLMSQQERDSLLKKLVANARAIISYQVGLPVGCVKMERILGWLKVYEPLNYPVFQEYLRAAIGLPLSSERLYCNRQALRQSDERLVAINLKYREEIIDACFEILDRYG